MSERLWTLTVWLTGCTDRRLLPRVMVAGVVGDMGRGHRGRDGPSRQEGSAEPLAIHSFPSTMSSAQQPR